jgi:hypothetical protein
MYNASENGVKIGDRVRWISAAGTIRGEVVGMRLGLTAANTLAPWVMIEHIQNNRAVKVELCGTESNLKMMQFRVIFRDAVAA